MKFIHVVSTTILAVAFLAVNSAVEIVPWSYIYAVTGILAGIGALYFFGDDLLTAVSRISFSKERGNSLDLTVSPNEASNWLNNRVEDIPGYKRIDFDTTSAENTVVHTKTRPYRFDGEKGLMWGAIGRPENPEDRELVAYVVDLKDGYIMDYSGNLHTPEDRLDPFNGEHQWLITEGYMAKTENKGRQDGSPINIYQGPSREDRDRSNRSRGESDR